MVKTPFLPGYQQLTSVILASWEAKIGRIKASPAKKLSKTHLNRKKLGVVAHTCHPRYVGSMK
jgi:hypothetical protein